MTKSRRPTRKCRAFLLDGSTSTKNAKEDEVASFLTLLTVHSDAILPTVEHFLKKVKTEIGGDYFAEVAALHSAHGQISRSKYHE